MKHIEVDLVLLINGLRRTKYIETHVPADSFVGMDGDVYRIGQIFTYRRDRVLSAKIIDERIVGKVRKLSEKEEKVSN